MTISITTQASEIPENLPPSDFGFYIDYDQRDRAAKHIFEATYRFIEACEASSQALLGSAGVSIEPVIVLENITTGSIKTWFKIFWQEEGEEAAKSGSLKRFLVTLSVEGIKKILSNTNNVDDPPELRNLQNDLFELVNEVDMDTLSLRFPIPDKNLIDVITRFESVKELLGPEDRAALVLSDDTTIRLNQSVSVNIEKLKKEATKETLVNPTITMILIVRKPDYLANSQWSFRHERRTIAATIEDRKWLSEFQGRKIDVRPGDALKCQVRIETSYGFDNEVISQKHCIEKVEEVIENEQGGTQMPQLFGRE